ncbi:MAG: AAA family ATPase [Candidatus Competibacter sp.]|nr:AAA family ATPase [Candidatus Competibacter sp.]
MRFPYGIADFAALIQEGYFYVDRTDRIALLEEAGSQLLFLRPRRFGKSLWLSTLESYYDLARADDFDRLFGGLKIGQNPTPLHDRYFVMRWDFSLVDPKGDADADAIATSLYSHVNNAIESFAVRYQDWIDHPIECHPTDGLRSFGRLLTAISTTPYKLYLLIDEYDNFANEVMVTVHSPLPAGGGWGRASRWRRNLSPLPTSPRWGEGSERLPTSCADSAWTNWRRDWRVC